MLPCHTEHLQNGLTVEFFDRSNRYFGDYWHLDLEVRCSIPVAAAGLSAEEADAARRLLGETVFYGRRLERMGVATDAVAGTRLALITDFFASARPYLESPAFPGRMVRSRLVEAQRHRRPYLVR